MIKDSGNRTEFKSGAVRDIQEGKGRCDLLPLSVIGCWCESSAYSVLGCINLYMLRPATNKMCTILDKFAYIHRNSHDTCKNLEQYRYELVLEVSKHFEEGAKKYGDRNWEKGIPCDRYIDSAVRHYCKWRAGWTDEPHDRAFIWNILCCEWTRQKYGWNLERLGEKGDETAIKEFIDKIGSGNFAEKAHKLGDPVIPILTGLLHYDHLMSGSLEKTASAWENETRFTRCACRYLYDKYGHAAGRVWILDAEKSADLTPAINYMWTNNNVATPKMLELRLVDQGWTVGVDFIVESFDEKSESKKGVKIGEHLAKGVYDGICLNDDTEITMTVEGDFSNLFDMLDTEEPKKDQEIGEKTDIKAVLETMKKSLNCRKLRRENLKKCLDTSCSECEYNTELFLDSDALQALIDYVEKSLKVQERRNPCVKDTDTGWHFYGINGKLVACIFDFKEPEEGKRLQLDRMLHKVWREVTGNPYTIKRIVEEWGYVCGKDFSIFIAPSEVAKEYKFCNRKYNEEE